MLLEGVWPNHEGLHDPSLASWVSVMALDAL